MAGANISEAKNQLSCSVCLDLLKDPVTIPCGHSYCMDCFTGYWNKQGYYTVYSCPLCKRTFTTRSTIGKNNKLAKVVEKLRTNKVQTTSNAEPGDVECDICIGSKRKAEKSCLACLQSYCQTHFERHEEFHSGRHKMTEATGQLKQMICSKHNKQLEIFCRTDQCCICYLCTMDEHRYHDTVAAVVERTEKQMSLKEKQRTLQQTIQEKDIRIRELKGAVQTHKRSAQTAVEDSERIFTELIRFIERRRSEVTQTIRDREKTEVSRAEGLLKKLEQEIEDLKRRNSELEQRLDSDDHIFFLQNLQSLPSPAESTDVSNIAVGALPSFDEVRISVSHLKEQLESLCKEEMAKVFDKVKQPVETPIYPDMDNLLVFSHLSILKRKPSSTRIEALSKVLAELQNRKTT